MKELLQKKLEYHTLAKDEVWQQINELKKANVRDHEILAVLDNEHSLRVFFVSELQDLLDGGDL